MPRNDSAPPVADPPPLDAASSPSELASPEAVSPEEWRELKEFVGFDDADAVVLMRLEPIVAPHLVSVADRFERGLLRSQASRPVLADIVEGPRIRALVLNWLVEMFSGSYGSEYWDRQRRIGRAQAKAGVSERHLFTAMNRVREDIIDIIWPEVSELERRDAVRALSRLMDLESALMMSAYMEAHEERRLRTLQDLIVENLPVTVLCLDAQGRVTSATRPSARLFGTNAEIDCHYEAFLPGELIEAADLPTHVGRTLATGLGLAISRKLAEAMGGTLELLPLELQLLAARGPGARFRFTLPLSDSPDHVSPADSEAHID